ncbi:MAG TPA: hypothetical protein VJT73_11330 [Polyangiaceae bacterium]|nr:hypothetical protein [Polyangiaceae bacterium]
MRSRSFGVVGRAVVMTLGMMACSGSSTPDVADVVPIHEGSDRIPCEPRSILQGVCQKCHTQPLLNGAPFPLIDRSDIVRIQKDGVEVRAAMIAQLETGRMPLTPETIDDVSRGQLLNWLRAGAPAEPPHSCSNSNGSDAGEPSSSESDAESPDVHESETVEELSDEVSTGTKLTSEDPDGST